MPGRLNAIRAFARVCGGGSLLAGAAAVPLALHVLPVGPIRVPGQPDVRAVIWPLTPALAALGVPDGARCRFREWTAAAVRPRWQVRGWFLAMVGTIHGLVGVLSPLDRAVVVRNLLLFDGIALLTIVVANRPTWAPVAGSAAMCWLAGIEPPSAVASWAVPLLPAGDRASWCVAGATAAAGAIAFVLPPPTRRRRISRPVRRGSDRR